MEVGNKKEVNSHQYFTLNLLPPCQAFDGNLSAPFAGLGGRLGGRHHGRHRGVGAAHLASPPPATMELGVTRFHPLHSVTHKLNNHHPPNVSLRITKKFEDLARSEGETTDEEYLA